MGDEVEEHQRKRYIDYVWKGLYCTLAVDRGEWEKETCCDDPHNVKRAKKKK